jgi:hypothetical protein
MSRRETCGLRWQKVVELQIRLSESQSTRLRRSKRSQVAEKSQISPATALVSLLPFISNFPSSLPTKTTHNLSKPRGSRKTIEYRGKSDSEITQNRFTLTLSNEVNYFESRALFMLSFRHSNVILFSRNSLR